MRMSRKLKTSQKLGIRYGKLAQALRHVELGLRPGRDDLNLLLVPLESQAATARWLRHLVYKHVRGSRLTRCSRIPNCTLDLGRLSAWTLQETNTAAHHLGSLFPHVHTETQRPHNKASLESLALPRTKRNDLSNWE